MAKCVAADSVSPFLQASCLMLVGLAKQERAKTKWLVVVVGCFEEALYFSSESWRGEGRHVSSPSTPQVAPKHLLKLLFWSECSKNIFPYMDLQWVEIAPWGELSGVSPKGKGFCLKEFKAKA